MKILKMIIAVAAFSALTASPVQARDSYGLSINIGGYGHGYHHHRPYIYHRYREPTVYYYGAPSVIYHEPRRVYRTHSYRGHRHYRGHDYGYKHHKRYKRHKRHARKHQRRHDNRRYGRHNGWR